MDYLSIVTTGDVNDDSVCYVAKPPEGMERHAYRLVLGNAARKLMPSPARIRLEDRYPGIKLPGYIGSSNGFLIFSSAACAIIRRFCPKARIEYFPFELI